MLRLKDLREDHELTQEQCAKIGYIAKNSYIRYEKEEKWKRKIIKIQPLPAPMRRSVAAVSIRAWITLSS